MTDFLTSNKRKSLSLLALARGIVLWGGAALASFLILAPAGLSIKAVEVFSTLAGRTDRKAFSAMLASLKAAKKDDPVYFGSHFGGASTLSKAGGSSVAMIKGRPEDIAAADLTSKLGGAVTVKGILTPEDARKRVNGLSISPDEVGGERETLAAGGKAQDLGATPAYATKSFFAGNGGAAHTGDHLKAALEAAEVPAFAPRDGGPTPGRIPKAQALAFRDEAKMLVESNAIEGINRPLTQLAQGQVAAQGAKAARTSEAAAGSTAGIYDGLRQERSRLVRDAASLPKVDGASVPRIPGGAEVKLKADLIAKTETVRGKKRAVYGGRRAQ